MVKTHNAYHWFRTEVFNVILLEYEKEILYWRGKEIARKEDLSDYQKLQSFFAEMSLGNLDYCNLEGQKHRVVITDSPLSTMHEGTEKTIALECGIVTGALQLIFKKSGEGVARWISNPTTQPPYIEVNVILSSNG